jgi:hypothetical protein
MHALLVATVLGVLVSASLPQAPTLTSQQIDAAIREGRAGRTQQATCKTTVTPQGFYFEVTALGPAGRVMRAAHEAAKRGEAFDADRVTALQLAPEVTVTVAGHVTEPSDPGPLRAFEGEIPPPPMPKLLRTPPGVLNVTFAGTSIAPPRLTSQIPLDAFLAIGDRVEVTIRTTLGETSCWLQPGAITVTGKGVPAFG